MAAGGEGGQAPRGSSSSSSDEPAAAGVGTENGSQDDADIVLDEDSLAELYERFYLATKIVDLKFDILDMVEANFNPALPMEAQHDAMRRMREEVERKEARNKLERGGDEVNCGGNASGVPGDEDFVEKFVRASGYWDRMQDVRKMIDTYFDEDLDDEECKATITELCSKLGQDLDARANAVSTGIFRL
jgi:hypothetical protein